MSEARDHRGGRHRDGRAATEQLSVVVPVLDEADHLPGLLEQLRAQQGVDLEVLVSDGGSTDGSADIAAAAGVRVIEPTAGAERGRAVQMNRAAAEAGGDWLLFLHADSAIDDPWLLGRAVGYLRTVEAAYQEERLAGHFRLRFARASSEPSFAYRYLEAKTALNRPNTTNGDQGMLLRRGFFEDLGGFDASLPFLEDQRLAEQVRRVGRWVTLPGRLTTSARRFETEGFGRRYLLMAITMGVFDAGVDLYFERAEDLYRPQSELERLDLAPHLERIRQVTLELGPRRATRAWMGVGRFIRQNTWQLFFAGDVALEPLLPPEARPLLAAYDRLIDPVLDRPAFDALTAALSAALFLGVLPPAVRVNDLISSA